MLERLAQATPTDRAAVILEPVQYPLWPMVTEVFSDLEEDPGFMKAFGVVLEGREKLATGAFSAAETVEWQLVASQLTLAREGKVR